jgi:hypothetical protein
VTGLLGSIAGTPFSRIEAMDVAGLIPMSLREDSVRDLGRESADSRRRDYEASSEEELPVRIIARSVSLVARF